MEDFLIFHEEESEPKKKPYKILFIGLDGAGKTSIISALHSEFSKIALIEPTRGVQRSSFKLMGSSPL